MSYYWRMLKIIQLKKFTMKKFVEDEKKLQQKEVGELCIKMNVLIIS